VPRHAKARRLSTKKSRLYAAAHRDRNSHGAEDGLAHGERTVPVVKPTCGRPHLDGTKHPKRGNAA